MPLVTQLREGAHPLIFPTDLSISTTMDKNVTTSSSTASSIADRKSPTLFGSPTGSNGGGNNGNCGGGSGIGDIGSGSTGGTTIIGGNNNNCTPCSGLIGGNTGNLSSSSLGSNSGNNTNTGNNLCGISLLSSIGTMNSNLMISNNNMGGHPCPDCGRVYKLKSSLRNHQKWECGKEPQFQCPYCVYRAKQKMHIGRHMERMHKEKYHKLEGDKVFTVDDVMNINHTF